jgi:hypothetical protein
MLMWGAENFVPLFAEEIVPADTPTAKPVDGLCQQGTQ